LPVRTVPQDMSNTDLIGLILGGIALLMFVTGILLAT
jgi:hypothetical protein